MNKLQICRHTGIRNKGPHLNAIEILKKESVLKSEKAKNHKQKEIMKLTLLGQEIVNLMNDIEAAKHAYLKFKETYFEYLKLNFIEIDDEGIEPETILKSRLRNRGWTKEECKSFDQIIDSLRKTEIIYRRNICNALLNRYYVIQSSFKISDIIEKLIVKIVLSEVSRQMSLQSKDVERYYTVFPNNSLAESLLQHISEEYIRHMISNRFTSKIIKELITSLLRILKPTGYEIDFAKYLAESDKRYLEEETTSTIETSRNQKSSQIKLKNQLLQLRNLLEIMNLLK
jgi:hypothetical protein